MHVPCSLKPSNTAITKFLNSIIQIIQGDFYGIYQKVRGFKLFLGGSIKFCHVFNLVHLSSPMLLRLILCFDPQYFCLITTYPNLYYSDPYSNNQEFNLKYKLTNSNFLILARAIFSHNTITIAA